MAMAMASIMALLHDCNRRKKDRESCRKLHVLLALRGLDSLPLFGDHVIRAFKSCRSLADARRAFLKIRSPSVYTWNAILSAFSELSPGADSLSLFSLMLRHGARADRVTFLCLFKVCAAEGSAPTEGKLAHAAACESGLDVDTVLGSAVIQMYSSCGCIDECRKVFDGIRHPNVVSWGALISCYAENCDGMQALLAFEEMMLSGKEPAKPTFLYALKACASIAILVHVYVVHDLIVRSGILVDLVVESTLLDAYAKCGGLAESQTIFDRLPGRDVVSWDALISGYAQHGDVMNAFKLLEDMQEEGISPDEVSFLSILKACSGPHPECALGLRLLHHIVIKSGFESHVALSNSLVDMYAKCGSLGEACKLFAELKVQSIVSCSAMISGYVEEGEGIRALGVLEKMQKQTISPDRVALVALLKACAMMGCVCMGRLMHGMAIEIGLHADTSLGNTLVDMYAKCTSIADAHKVFEKSSNRDMVSWHAIISGHAQQGDCVQMKELIGDMHQQGIKLDDTVYKSILVGCTYVGLLDEGHSYFKSMRENHEMTLKGEHFNCVVDLLGRAGHLIEAQYVLQTLPVLPNLIGWSTLLSGCKIHGNAELGRHCFSELFRLDSRDASSYTMISGILSSCLIVEDHQESLHLGAL